MGTCPRANVHHIVCRQHGILVMLHHDQGIPQIPEIFQSVQKLVIVPLVQADTGLVQNIADSHQPGTDLGGKSDSLCFPAGQSAGGPGQ